MIFNKKITQLSLGIGASGTITDALHDLPYKNLTVWIRPLDSSAAYNFSVDYGGAVQTSGSKSGGQIATYNDPQIQPPNNPSANWSEQNPDSPVVPFVVGVPINVNLTNTTGRTVLFNVSVISESHTQGF